MNYQTKQSDSSKKANSPTFSSPWVALFTLLRANWTQNQTI